MRLGLRSQVGQVDVALASHFTDHDLEPGHDGAGRVGAVGGERDQADVAVALAARFVIGADHQQTAYSPCEPALGWSETAGEAGDLREPDSSCWNSFWYPARLVRAARTDAAGRTRGQVTGIISVVALSFMVHEPSGIIDVGERQVARLQALDVAQHLRFGVIAVEDRVGEVGAGAAERRRDRRLARRRQLRPA